MKNVDYILRNDLAIQNRKYKKINTYIQNNIKVEEYIYKEFSFVDVFFKNVETNKSKNVLKGILISELKKLMKKYALKKNDSCLVVGLGNKNIISDALGPKTSENIIATGYFELLNIADYRNVYAYVPGTTKESGMEPFKSVKALVKELRPSFVIIIDSLVCSHIKYLNSVVQISDYGIRPGSGLANYSRDISLDNIGIPVFVMGVPTATFASTIIRDVMNVKKSHISFKEGYDFMVVSQNVDIVIDDLSKIISKSINETLNNLKNF